MLVPMIRDILAETGSESKPVLDGIAISAGPGSYTGLRIGASTAKGLCTVFEAPLLAVDTTHALADSATDRLALNHGAIGVAMKSRRGEIYAAAFSFPAINPIQPVQPLAIREIADWLSTFDIDAITGDAAEIVEEYLPRAVRVPIVPLGPTIARLGRRQLKKGDTVDVASFEPTYLKPVATTRPKTIFQNR